MNSSEEKFKHLSTKNLFPTKEKFSWPNNIKRENYSPRNWIGTRCGEKYNSFIPFLNNVECYRCKKFGHKAPACKFDKKSAIKGMDYDEIQQRALRRIYFSTYKKGRSNGEWR